MTTYINQEILTNYMNNNNLNKTAFCKKCGIGIKTYNLIIQGSWNLGLNVFFKIAKATGIELNQLFKESICPPKKPKITHNSSLLK